MFLRLLLSKLVVHRTWKKKIFLHYRQIMLRNFDVPCNGVARGELQMKIGYSSAKSNLERADRSDRVTL